MAGWGREGTNKTKRNIRIGIGTGIGTEIGKKETKKNDFGWQTFKAEKTQKK